MLCLGAALSAASAEVRIDFGSPDALTVGGGGGATRTWNNLTATIAADEFGEIPSLVSTEGVEAGAYLYMLSRFNGANENGTTAAADYPASATRDSLYGNTEAFNGLENIVPRFAIGGLNPATPYNLTFYASRTGVTDNRQTRYTVTGGTTATADLNVANNIDESVTIEGMRPNSFGDLTIELTPGPDNNNANHFTYLGVLRLEPQAGGGPTYLIDAGATGSLTELEEPPSPIQWNNVPVAIGAADDGELNDLVSTNGTPTGINLRMLARFNGANQNGSAQSTLFPASATGDSLFGNTEAFSGLENIFPRFKLTGLSQDNLYRFTFYASRTGVSDNRETRYTVTGATTASADLNTANNVDTTVVVDGIAPDAAGEISLALTPGPNNNNGSHFTYLGVLTLDWRPLPKPQLLIDFGATGTPTEFGASDPDRHWNNLTAAVGSTDDGVLSNLVDVAGANTGYGIAMVARFNGANENGTLDYPDLPTTATRDSLYGNTEPWSGLENIFPVFKLTGLNPATTYDLTFYASRMGVGDNRETRYTLTGLNTETLDFNPANNIDQSAAITGLKPDAAGEITIALTPSPNNDNGNHFTYLGILRLDWVPAIAPTPASLSDPQYASGTFRFLLTGTAGATYRLERTGDFAEWQTVRTVTLTGASDTIEVTQPESASFYRVAE